jgi:hypothetical protein
MEERFALLWHWQTFHVGDGYSLILPGLLAIVSFEASGIDFFEWSRFRFI